MRRGLRRPYRLVRTRVLGSRLNVFTGTRGRPPSRAGARARTGARGLRAEPLETLRRLAFALAGGLLSVSRGRRERDGARAADMRRGGRGRG